MTRLLTVTATVLAVAAVVSSPALGTSLDRGDKGKTPPPAKLKPTDDATVLFTPAKGHGDAKHDDKPGGDQNFGDQSKLRVRGGPAIERAYLKFDTRGAATVRRATLYLYAFDGSRAGIDVHGAAGSNWSEKRITWANAPAMLPDVADSSGTIHHGTSFSLDVTSLVKAGDFSTFVLATDDANQVVLGSEESGHDPYLVVEANHAPNAQDDAVNGQEARPLTIPASQLLANDTDPDGDALTVTAVAAGADTHGTVSLSGTTVTYTPAAGFTGAASFQYTVSDPAGANDTANVAVTVANVPPTAQAGSATTNEGSPVAVALAATDPGSPPETISFALAGLPAHGTAALAGNQVTYTPNAGYSGADSFTFTASDGSATSAPATVSLTVRNVAPTASPQSASTSQATPVTVTLSATDPGSPPEALTFAVASPPAHGSATVSGAQATYTPSGGFSGDDSFTYTASDGTDASAPATVTVHVIPSGPSADDFSVSADSNTPLVLTASSIVAHAHDPDGDTLTLAAVLPGSDTHGTVTVSGDHVTYVSDPGYSGPASFGYTASDGHGDTASATVNVTVDLQPTFPVRSAFYYSWFPESWIQGGFNPFTMYHPTLGFYDSTNPAVIDAHIHALDAAHVRVAISSWWGVAHRTNARLPLLLSETAALHSPLRWAIYYEPEGQTDPSVAQLTADLQYIQANYASDPSYERVGGKFVVFVYDGGPSDPDAGSCATTERWNQANAAVGNAAFIVLKVFNGFKNCSAQPDAWHQYAPDQAESRQFPWADSISPGFNKPGESGPRLGRDLTRWNQNILSMVASGVPFQLVTSFNEWGEGTAVESADEWPSTSGFGQYVDALAADGGAGTATTAPSINTNPFVSGRAQVGQTLTIIPGAWNGGPGAPTFTYQFRRCDSGGGNCVDIPGATGQSYVLTSDDRGSTLKAYVTATNAAGSATKPTQVTPVVVDPALPSTAGTCGTAPTPPAAWQHVVWIFLENHAAGQIMGSSAAPYLNSVASACGQATNYAGVAHPSLPNYIAATSGGTQGITNDNPPSSNATSAPSIYTQLLTAGLTWRDYEESSPGGCPTGSSGLYAVKHDPAAYYTSIPTSVCANWDEPLGTLAAGNFATDLANGTLPSFSFVTPNLCNDMHDCNVAAGDNWLRSWLPKIIASPNYQAGNTVIFVTFDENDGSTGNVVPMVVVSPSTPAGMSSATAFTHYSLLRTTEEMLGLPTTLGGAATATSMLPDFHL